MKLHEKFIAVEKELNGHFVERTEPIRGIILATITKLNVLLLGPAGVAKSALIRKWNDHVKEAKYFERLLTKYTTPDELFGPYSLKALDEDKFLRATQGMLTDANSVFIDEIFKANSSILNSMLTILNERIFFNGPAPTKLDLYTIAGASNEVPDSEDNLDAFFDRFLLKYHVEYIKEEGNFLQMLNGNVNDDPTALLSKKDIINAQEAIDSVEFPEEMQQLFVKLRKSLKHQGFSVSDRSYKLTMRLLKAEAWLAGRDRIDTPDFEVLKHVVWTHPDQKKKAQSLILDLIAPEKNRVYELLEMSRTSMQQVFDKKQSKERHDQALEALSKLKDASKEIAKLKNIMAQRGSSIAEVEQCEKEVESMKKHLLTEELGVGK